MGLALALLLSLTGHAQWLTQSVSLKSGWNAVYLHVDASHESLDTTIGGDVNNPIQEVWMWLPTASAAQFVQSPQVPLDTGSQWLSWNRSQAPSATLTRLTGNAAYLVRVGDAPAGYTWAVFGQPVAPRYLWSTTGLNFLGFPTPPDAAPTFETFLAPAPQLLLSGEFYAYGGGNLGATNPQRLFALRTARLPRGQAFWMRMDGGYNRYFGPFEVTPGSASGVHFGDRLGQHALRLRNLTSSNVTVTLELVSSEAPPAGHPSLVGTPPLLVRGTLNLTNLTYGHTNLAATRTWVLAPAGRDGAEVEVVLGLNRSQMTGAPGALHAGILRFRDTLGLAQVDLPVSASVASDSGLWVGAARVMDVRQYLKTFQQDADGRPTQAASGAYRITSVNTNLGTTARAFPLRLIFHTDTHGQTVLLQRVFNGLRQGTNEVLATHESVLDRSSLASARRLSAAHLPWSAANEPWVCSGRLALGTNLVATVAVAHDHAASNPFIHTYHPDHDSLNATFDQPLPAGFESYAVQRHLRLSVSPPPNDFASLTSGSQNVIGLYEETLTLTGKPGDVRTFQSEGIFSLTRISSIPALTKP